jgi:hypothetical protein
MKLNSRDRMMLYLMLLVPIFVCLLMVFSTSVWAVVAIMLGYFTFIIVLEILSNTLFKTKYDQ